MKTLTGLFSATILSCCLMTSFSASADTVYHRVYRQPMAASDPFSLLDTYQNNSLSVKDYKKGYYAPSFTSLDGNGDGRLTRSEFYGTKPAQWYTTNTAQLNMITPAAGGDVIVTEHVVPLDIIYRDDPCDSSALNDSHGCR